MKKFLFMGALALSLAVVSQQQASAWVNFKFGVGANMAWQSGGNNLLWGAFRNGQPPGPDCGHGGHGATYGQPAPQQGFETAPPAIQPQPAPAVQGAQAYNYWPGALYTPVNTRTNYYYAPRPNYGYVPHNR